mmetsp:Transcript_5256/g.7098  ORF Transcript_5256/g.7098 Transcript_5256/m.7098 type:complete len:227 (-) Transcript_5256:106-786(-)
MKFQLSLITALAIYNQAVLAAEEEHDHFCACEAEEFGFEIDCTQSDEMIAAMENLASAGCAQDCSTEECEKNWLLVQTHHDYCPTDVLPQTVEDGFHDYDEECASCDITRQPIDGLENCTVSACDNSGNEAYDTLLDLGCNSNCTLAGCEEAYFTLLTTHDQCDHDVLSDAAEDGYHDMEEACEDLYKCNAVGKDPLVCVEEESAGFTVASVVGAAVAVVSAAMLL